jgi:hypothetical protein
MSNAARNLKPYKPGQSGNPGGKPKRLFPRVDQILKDLGREPIAELMLLLPKLREREQADVWKELLPYVHGKPQFVDDSPDPLEEMSDEQLLRLVKENAKAFAESK